MGSPTLNQPLVGVVFLSDSDISIESSTGDPAVTTGYRNRVNAGGGGRGAEGEALQHEWECDIPTCQLLSRAHSVQ